MNQIKDVNVLDCLIHWPKDSIGWHQEKQILDLLNDLCKKHGYGRIPQLANQIREIWENPEVVQKFLERQDKSAKFMESCRNVLTEDF